ncbi:MAG: hypothetical protein HYX69_12730 [Planctomycetia bacterium]|nr:hypothetical protein [Planctomycetia bacterium]
MHPILASRPLVFLLAFLSFACLLGQFYGLWSMHFFGCWVLPPATALLIYIAYSAGGRPRMWIVEGAVAGVVAAIAYDLYRLPYVIAGTPLFKVFPKFGELLLGADSPRWAVQALGWAYHFSNGAALGIMFLALVWRPTPRVLFWGAILWALFVEGMLLLTPYTSFFGLTLDAWFVFLTASAHLVFGAALGAWCWFRGSRIAVA